MVSLPLHYSTPDAVQTRYPVVYALDAEPYLFPLLATAARTEHFFKRTTWYPDLIVVGIVADIEEEFRNSDAWLFSGNIWKILFGLLGS